jgi:hypothetical protein
MYQNKHRFFKFNVWVPRLFCPIIFRHQKERTMARKNGLEYPRSTDQLFTITVYPLLTIGFFVIAGRSIDIYDEHFVGVIVIVLHSLLSVGVLLNWFCVSTLDPSQSNKEPSCIFVERNQRKPYYCMHCNKKIPGFDHHCVWLNTCVGSRNYPYFYFLSVFGTLQFGLQIIVYALTIFKISNSTSNKAVLDFFGGKTGCQVVLVILICLATVVFLAFSSLCLFHSYLRGSGLSTYEWVSIQHETYDEKVRRMKENSEVDVERKRAKEREDWARRMKEKNKKSKISKAQNNDESSAGKSNVELAQSIESSDLIYVNQENV